MIHKKEIVKKVEIKEALKTDKEKNELEVVLTNRFVKSKIILIRDKLVIIDRDVAEIYGVTTKEINQAVKNNPNKFPARYIMELDNQSKEEVVKNFDHLSNLVFSHAPVKAFTEQGLYMLATILKGEIATKMTIQIIDTFTDLREIANNLDKAGDSKTEKDMGICLTEAGTKLSNMLLKNMIGDTKKVKTTLEVNLGIFRAKLEVEEIKNKK